MNDDITRMLNFAAGDGPDPKGWADAARRRHRRRSARLALTTALVLVAVTIPVSTLLGGSPRTEPAPAHSVPAPSSTPSPSQEALPSESPSGAPVESSPAEVEDPVSYSPGVEHLSYQQETLAARHPDVFAGWDMTAGEAVLLYKASEEESARRLAVEAGVDAPPGRLEAREHSWNDLMARRAGVVTRVAELGLDVFEVMPDPRETDGVVLVVYPGQTSGPNRVGTDEQWQALMAAGVTGLHLLDPPAATRYIHGVPVKSLDHIWTGYQLTPHPDAEKAYGLLCTRPDICAQGRISPAGDRTIIQVKESRLQEARDLLADAGLDPAAWELEPVRLSQNEVVALQHPLMERAAALGVTVHGASPDMERGGVTLGVADLEEFAALPDSALNELKSLGLTSLEEQEEVGTLAMTIEPNPTPS